MLKAIVFDFDGVIVDSERLHYEAFATVSRGFGLKFTYETYVQQYIGFDDRDGFRAMLSEQGKRVDEHQISALCHQKGRCFEAIVAKGVQVYPGVLELIQCAAATMPLAIASGASRRDIELILNKLALCGRFDPIISADDVGRSKPDPETYVAAVLGLARQNPHLEIKPRQCLAIEDTSVGIVSARTAGLRTLGVAHTEPAEDLRVAEAEHVVNSFAEVHFDLLQGWFDLHMDKHA